MILENHQICHFACASHNIRSISAVMEMAQELNVPESRYEFQVLYGMAEPVRKGILKVAGRIRLYCPYGDMVPGMGYLVRRLLENTANESFLRQSFAEDAQIERLLEDPAVTAERERAERTAKPRKASDRPRRTAALRQRADGGLHPGRPPRRLSAAPSPRCARSLGKTYPLYIDGTEVVTADTCHHGQPGQSGRSAGQDLPGRNRVKSRRPLPPPRRPSRPGATPRPASGPNTCSKERKPPAGASSNSPPGRCWKSANSGTRPMPTSPRRSTSSNTMPAR